MAVGLRFGWGLSTLFALILVWASIALFRIDFDEMLLPDLIVIPGIWLGLISNYLGCFTSLENSLIGALAGYLCPALPAWIFEALVKRQGMGSGDFKLLVMFGAALGWQAIPLIVLLSSAVCALFGLCARRRIAAPFPFGPFIIAAGLLTLFYCHEIYTAYSHAAGFEIGVNFFE